MAIQKMELLSIAGPINEFERIVGRYVLDLEFNVENSLSALREVKGLQPFEENALYTDLLGRARELLERGGIDIPEGIRPKRADTTDDLRNVLGEVEGKLEQNRAEQDEIKKRLAEIDQIETQLEHMKAVEVNLDELFRFSFIKFRFGRLPRAGYKKLKSYLQDIDAFFVEGEVEKDYIYGAYFMPAAAEERIDAIFTSLYFERIIISGESHGTPAEALEQFQARRQEYVARRSELEAETQKILGRYRDTLLEAYAQLLSKEKIETVRKYAAHTKESFYLIGWTPRRNVKKIERAFAGEKDVIAVVEEPNIVTSSIRPPIRLRNPRILRPFESFVEMYGLPSYTELDPTPIFALTYILMFGIMFGDVGHGFVLAVAGLAYYLWKKQDIGAIVSMAGVSSMAFGFCYSDMFGSDELLLRYLPQLHVISPMEQINTILVATVGLGVVIILIAMALNLVNCARRREWGKFWFDQNGVAGILFYLSAVLMLAPMVCGMFQIDAPKPPIGNSVLLAVMLVALVAIYLKEPLSNLVAGEKEFLPKEKGDYFLSAAFELLEIVLSFATNTISFVRLGAFALAHAGMMSVVFIFSDMVGGGVGSVIVQVFGNILVMALEGLVVGIQSLRLEFYEMFSRFYTGEGRPFTKVDAIR